MDNPDFIMLLYSAIRIYTFFVSCDRVKDKNCSELQETTRKCVYSDYNEDTKDTENFGDGSKDYMRYKSKSETKMGPFKIRSSNTYEGDGYVFDIYPYQTLTELLNQIELLRDINWIDENTKMIAIAGNYYDINYNQVQSFIVLFGNLIFL